MTNSLGLDDDLDGVDLVRDIEAAFGCRFSDAELEQCRTVGDLFDAVAAHLPDDACEGRCATAMTFYRLRRAFQPQISTKLRPCTPIAVLSTIPTKEIHRIIEKDCHFRAPISGIVDLLGLAALILLFPVPIIVVASGDLWWLAIASAALGYAVLVMAPTRLRTDIATFGDLVRIVSSRNIGLLASEGARLRAQEAWEALKEILADHSSLPIAKQDIARQTLILDPKYARR